jgi:D-glycero-alpha-D-manno-heptose 1-phosphate guanylyltransferase
MEAIILAGGFGTRLHQRVPNVPKPMARVAGRPLLEILLSLFARKGFRRVVLSLGYMSEQVVEHFGNRFSGIELVYEIEETPLGTGGAIRQALERCSTDHVFVFNGDTFLDVEAPEVEGLWRAHRLPVIVAVDVLDSARYGRLGVAHGRVSSFLEEGLSGPGLINAGCYVFPKTLLNEFPVGTAFSLEKDFLAKAVTQQRFDVFVTKGRFIDIGIPEDYQRAQTELAGVCV